MESCSRVFVYEVFYPGTSSSLAPIRSCRQVFFQVPFHRMAAQTRLIQLLGGKILSIKPLNGNNDAFPSMEKFLPWWVEVYTATPKCLYYFGPFASSQEAQFYQPEYLEDLEGEGAQGISVKIKQCQPTILTQES